MSSADEGPVVWACEGGEGVVGEVTVASFSSSGKEPGVGIAVAGPVMIVLEFNLITYSPL